MNRTVVSLNSLLVVVALIVIVAPLALAQEDHASNERTYNPEQFENEGRGEWQKVDQVIEAMGIRQGSSIADIGGGSGYFSRPFAKAVGPEGVVYCCDLATNLMDYLQESSKKEGLDNIVTVYAATDRPMIPPASVDIIFFCNTNHHLGERVPYYSGLEKLLRPGGRVVVVDWKNEDQKVGPPPDHTHPRSRVIDEMDEAGWVLQEEHSFLPYQYFLIFQSQKTE